MKYWGDGTNYFLFGLHVFTWNWDKGVPFCHLVTHVPMKLGYRRDGSARLTLKVLLVFLSPSECIWKSYQEGDFLMYVSVIIRNIRIGFILIPSRDTLTSKIPIVLVKSGIFSNIALNLQPWALEIGVKNFQHMFSAPFTLLYWVVHHLQLECCSPWSTPVAAEDWPAAD